MLFLGRGAIAFKVKEGHLNLSEREGRRVQSLFRNINRNLVQQQPQQTLEVGRQVLVHLNRREDGEPKKFMSKWKGPMQIVEHAGHTGYVVLDARGRRLVVHASKVKPFIQGRTFRPGRTGE